MNEWKPQDWVLILTAIGTFIGVVLSAVTVFIANLAKIKAERAVAKTTTIEQKVDANTEITVAGTTAATENAKAAANTAAEAKKAAVVAADKIEERLNGNIEHAVMTLDELTRYVKQRNHDILGAIQALSTKIDIVSLKMDKK